MPDRQPVAAACRQASMSRLPVNGSATCTVGRISRSVSNVRDASPDAPCIPSRPVSAPTSSSKSPGRPVDALMMLSLLTKPTHIALTSGFWE